MKELNTLSIAPQKILEFSQLFESMQEPCIVFDVDKPKFTVIAQNNSHAKMVKTEINDILGKPIAEAFPNFRETNNIESSNRLIDSLSKVLETKQKQTIDCLRFDVKRRDGSYREKYWYIENFPLIDEYGETYAIFQNARDITEESVAERKLSVIQQQLGQTEASMRFMANTIPHLVWISRADGQGEYFNNRWYEFTGTSVGDYDFDKIELIHAEDTETVIKKWKNSLKTGHPYNAEYRLYHAPTNSYRWIIARAEPYQNTNGEIIKWYGTCTDIHEKKHAAEVQEFLLNVSKKLNSTLEFDKILTEISNLCVPKIADWCSIDILSKDKKFEQVNVAHIDKEKVSAAKKFREYNPINIDDPSGVATVVRTNKIEYYPVINDEMIDQSPISKKSKEFMKSLKLRSIIIAPVRINKKPIGAITLAASDSGRSFSEEDVDLVEIFSARVSLALSNAKLYADSLEDLKERKRLQSELVREKQKLELRVKERTQQLILTNEGLREEVLRRREIEKELAEHTESLAQSNKELEGFAYVASHDLQEPLRKIQAFGNLLISEQEDKLDKESIDYLRRMQKAASRMSSLIQDLLSFSRVSTRQQQAKCVDLSEIADDVMLDIETRVHETGAEVKIGKLPKVMADPTHMRQLMQNLISNAIKFHRPDVKPRVNISAKSRNGWAEITVKDNGIGIEEQYRDKIFDVFQRLNTRSNYEGTGIGLAVCRKIVEKYGGEISVVTKQGAGTAFVVKMPLPKKGKRHDQNPERSNHHIDG